MKPLPAKDLRSIADAVAPLLKDWRGARLLVTGASGFFGRWLLESALELNRAHGMGLEIVAQSRNPERLLTHAPHLRAPNIRWWQVDPLNLSRSLLAGDQVFQKLVRGADGVVRLDGIIHLVTEADGAAALQRPVDAVTSIAETTRGALELAVASEARRVLFTSSGSVYGRRRDDSAGVRPRGLSEDDWGVIDPMDTSTAYAVTGHAKRLAEQWCATYAAQHQLAVTVARCFTFLGPGLPLDSKFAAGNFLADALAGRDIVVRGDGRPERSYLYVSDLATWLWTMLLRGQPGRAYNVGSETAVTLKGLGEVVRDEVAPGAQVTVLGQATGEGVADRFIPSTQRAREELGLKETVDLRDAVRRTAQWVRSNVEG